MNNAFFILFLMMSIICFITGFNIDFDEESVNLQNKYTCFNKRKLFAEHLEKANNLIQKILNRKNSENEIFQAISEKQKKLDVLASELSNVAKQISSLQAGKLLQELNNGYEKTSKEYGRININLKELAQYMLEKDIKKWDRFQSHMNKNWRELSSSWNRISTSLKEIPISTTEHSKLKEIVENLDETMRVLETNNSWETLQNDLKSKVDALQAKVAELGESLIAQKLKELNSRIAVLPDRYKNNVLLFKNVMDENKKDFQKHKKDIEDLLQKIEDKREGFLSHLKSLLSTEENMTTVEENMTTVEELITKIYDHFKQARQTLKKLNAADLLQSLQITNDFLSKTIGRK